MGLLETLFPIHELCKNMCPVKSFKYHVQCPILISHSLVKVHSSLYHKSKFFIPLKREFHSPIVNDKFGYFTNTGHKNSHKNLYNTFWMRGPQSVIAYRLAHHCTTSLTIFTHTSFHIYKIHVCTSTRDHYVVWNPSLSFSAFSCSSAILSASFLLCSSRNLGLSTEIKNIH